MQIKKNKSCGFTLIELLTVIAIIGILAAILIPTVGVVKEKATIATSKARISQYLTAIETFKGTYKFYPFSDTLNDDEFDLSIEANSRLFVETLSGRQIDDPTVRVTEGGNRRRVEFYTFTEDEISDGELVARNTVIDGFSNNRIIFVFDQDGDGQVQVPDPEGSLGSEKEMRATVTAYVRDNELIGSPGYFMYE